MNVAQKRLARKVLSINSSRKDKKQDLNSSLYDKRVFNEMREGLVDYPADKLKSALSGYITDPIFITSVTNDNGNITVNYRLLDENLNEELMNAEIGYGLDYIENIHLYANRQSNCSGRKIHRLKSVNSSKLTADQAKNKYKELLTQCYIAVYEHKLDANDPQVVEYRKQMNKLVDEFGYIYNTMDGYIKSLDKKYKNSIDFTSEDLSSGLFSKKEKPSLEILQIYKQLKTSIDNLIKAGTPADNATLKKWQDKAKEMEKQYDGKALKMALTASRRKINCSTADIAQTATEVYNVLDDALYNLIHKYPLSYNDILIDQIKDYLYMLEDKYNIVTDIDGSRCVNCGNAYALDYAMGLYDVLQNTVNELSKYKLPDNQIIINKIQSFLHTLERKYHVGKPINSSRKRLNCSLLPDRFYIQIPSQDILFEIYKDDETGDWDETQILPEKYNKGITYQEYLSPQDILQWYINDFGDARIISESEVDRLLGYEDDEIYGPDYEYYKDPNGSTVIQVEDIRPYFGDEYFNVETRGQYVKFIEFEDCTKQEMLNKLAEVIGATTLVPATESEFNKARLNSSRKSTRYHRRRGF